MMMDLFSDAETAGRTAARRGLTADSFRVLHSSCNAAVMRATAEQKQPMQTDAEG